MDSIEEQVRHLRNSIVSSETRKRQLEEENEEAERQLKQRKTNIADLQHKHDALHNALLADLPHDEVLDLDVGGTYFRAYRSTLALFQESVLATMVSTRWAEGARRSDGRIFLDFDPKAFEEILSFLRMYRLGDMDDHRLSKKAASLCRYLNIPIGSIEGSEGLVLTATLADCQSNSSAKVSSGGFVFNISWKGLRPCSLKAFEVVSCDKVNVKVYLRKGGHGPLEQQFESGLDDNWHSVLQSELEAGYKEANPAVLTMATFPFFFGVMFGDMGHGSILAAFGLFLVFNYETLKKNKVMKAIAQQRYLLMLMGFMATYCGMIYNDFFAIQVNFWGSCYDLNNPQALTPPTKEVPTVEWYLNKANTTSTDPNVADAPNCTYPFGLDIAWGIAKTNMLTFTNSIKMKLSVIFGVLHMSLGIGMKGSNMIYHRKWLELFTEVIAGFLLLFFLFGWMDIMIFMKFFGTPDIQQYNPVQTITVNGVPEMVPYGQFVNRQQQGVISVMVTTVFQFGAYTEKVPAEVPFFGGSLDTQYSVNLTLVVIAILLVFVMLCTKPCIVKFSSKKHVHEEIEFQQVNQQEDAQVRDKSSMGAQNPASINYIESRDMSSDEMLLRRQNDLKSLDDQISKLGVEEVGHHSFGEVFVHQMIETIEFALGTVSNTASYLRLWALSLAHQQLAETFLNLLFANAFKQESIFGTVAMSIPSWMALWSVSFGVLMCMDLLECFLHTIRLHWVEFQNKFFKGDGYKFIPYSYQTILQEVLDKE